MLQTTYKQRICNRSYCNTAYFCRWKDFTGNKLANIGIKVEKLQLSLTENEIKRKIEELFFQIISLEEKKNH